MKPDYEMVIGLEVHAELKTETKIFLQLLHGFRRRAQHPMLPGLHGHAGDAARPERKVVEYAVKAGLATHCRIAPFSKEDRKNYFYPDLPKAYQISQYDLPLCSQGYLEIECGGEKAHRHHPHPYRRGCGKAGASAGWRNALRL